MSIKEQIDSIIQRADMSQLEGKRILITGGSGFLGSWFIAVFQRLNEKFSQPVEVLNIDSFIATDQENYITTTTDPLIKFERGDISKINLDMGRFDYIIHAAGIASPRFYRKHPIETIEGMAFGLLRLLGKSVEWQPEGVLNFSSSEIYGNPHIDKVPMREDYNGNVSCLGPRSCYDESKRMGEAMCVAYHKIHEIKVNWVRPFNVYGPGMRVSDDRVVPKFIFQGLRGDPFTVHLPGKQTRTFCYITDAMVGFLKVLLHDKKGEVFNIGNSRPELKISTLADIINGELFENKIAIKKIEMPEEYPADQAQRRCPDIGKAKKELGYEPEIGLEYGLKMTYNWCKEQKWQESI